MPMAEDRPATSGRKRSGASYVHEWNRFVARSEAAGIRALPATPEDVAAYLENRAEAGARASTIKVVAAAIAHNHKDAGFDVPLRHGGARTVLDDLTQDDSPGPTRAWTWTATWTSGRLPASRAAEGAGTRNVCPMLPACEHWTWR